MVYKENRICGARNIRNKFFFECLTYESDYKEIWKKKLQHRKLYVIWSRWVFPYLFYNLMYASSLFSDVIYIVSTFIDHIQPIDFTIFFEKKNCFATLHLNYKFKMMLAIKKIVSHEFQCMFVWIRKWISCEKSF